MALLAAQSLTLEIAGRCLCRDLRIGFGAGENWALLGANGSGKTTLLHTLAGLRAEAAGRVLLEGRDLGDWPRRERARRLGVLFQDPEAAFPATVLETALTGRHPYMNRWPGDDPANVKLARGALAAMGMEGFSSRWLNTLSGGEHRRVEIAALLAQDAPILLLDEPTNHLDLHHQTTTLELLAARARRPEHLNIFVLHDVNLAARFCSHGLLLFGDGEWRQGRLTDILRRETLERLYRCRLREIRQGRDIFYLPV
jgi:iron complex transport system ATP-binding protein